MASTRVALAILICIAVTLIVQPATAEKKKKVIIKVPSKIKHIHHHHTRKIHIHKIKPVVVIKKETGGSGWDWWNGWQKSGSKEMKFSESKGVAWKKEKPVKDGRYKGPKRPPGGDIIYEEEELVWPKGGRGYGGWSGEAKSKSKVPYSRRPTGGLSDWREDKKGYKTWSEPKYYGGKGKRTPMTHPEPHYREPKGGWSKEKRKPKYKGKKHYAWKEGDYVGDQVYIPHHGDVWPEKKEHYSWHMPRGNDYKSKETHGESDSYEEYPPTSYSKPGSYYRQKYPKLSQSYKPPSYHSSEYSSYKSPDYSSYESDHQESQEYDSPPDYQSPWEPSRYQDYAPSNKKLKYVTPEAGFAPITPTTPWPSIQTSWEESKSTRSFAAVTAPKAKDGESAVWSAQWKSPKSKVNYGVTKGKDQPSGYHVTVVHYNNEKKSKPLR